MVQLGNPDDVSVVIWVPAKMIEVERFLLADLNAGIGAILQACSRHVLALRLDRRHVHLPASALRRDTAASSGFSKLAEADAPSATCATNCGTW